MKVYSWKTLLVTVFAGGGMLVYSVARIYRGDWFFGLIWAALSLGWIAKGLEASLTGEGYRKDIENGERGERIYGALFGKSAPVMKYGTAILIGVGAVFGLALPDFPWICVGFLLGALAYQLWLNRAARREMEREKEQEPGNG